jgi:hypothetical protein
VRSVVSDCPHDIPSSVALAGESQNVTVRDVGEITGSDGSVLDLRTGIR